MRRTPQGLECFGRWRCLGEKTFPHGVTCTHGAYEVHKSSTEGGGSLPKRSRTSSCSVGVAYPAVDDVWLGNKTGLLLVGLH